MADTRIKLTDSIVDIIMNLGEGNPGATNVLTQMLSTPNGIMNLLLLDSKHLYGGKIWELYKDVCHEDFDRFMYHVQIELPDQLTGKVSTTGPHAVDLSEDFWQKRTFGAPGSFWALQNPPTDAYEYPIK